jgi:hypothetical protein
MRSDLLKSTDQTLNSSHFASRVMRCASILLFLLFIAGCERTGNESPFMSGSDLDLGDEYRFTTAERETSPDEPPVVHNDSLLVWVRYPGGCEDHIFHLGHAVSADTARVWIRHDARGDECEEDFVERLRFRLPETVLERSHIRLVDPESELPLIVNR